MVLVWTFWKLSKDDWSQPRRGAKWSGEELIQRKLLRPSNGEWRCSLCARSRTHSSRFYLVIVQRALGIQWLSLLFTFDCCIWAEPKCYCFNLSLALQNISQWKDGLEWELDQTIQRPFCENNGSRCGEIRLLLLNCLPLQFSRIFHSSNLIVRQNKCAMWPQEEFIKHSKLCFCYKRSLKWNYGFVLKLLCSII